MRQIIPFKKELLFKTKISEITSISLEHTLHLVENDLVSGEFHISGDYKMTEASINREKFYFTLPFEINLDADYIKDTVNIDIDNFYYEVVNDDSLQVNIDVYVDGEKQEIIETKEELPEITEESISDSEIIVDDISDIDNNIDDDTKDNTIDNSRIENNDSNNEEKRSIVIDVLPEENKNDDIKIPKENKNELNKKEIEDNIVEKLDSKGIEINTQDRKKESTKEIDNNFENTVTYADSPKISLEDIDNSNKGDVIENNNFNFFNTDNFSTDTYVTYYVYIVKEDDTIDKIMEKFNVTKEELTNYNDISDIKRGCKLIIPAHNE